MRTSLLATCLLSLVPATSFAVDHANSWAVGYYDVEAPIGVRYQFAPRTALDVGIGFSSNSGFTADRMNTYRLEAGLPRVLVRTERADLFLRPGIMLRSTPYFLIAGPGESEARATRVEFKLHVGAEWHATDHLSLAVGQGISVMAGDSPFPGALYAEPPSKNMNWSTRGLSLTSLGFHWYFGSVD